jgi:Family of unknown function (DUF6270)
LINIGVIGSCVSRDNFNSKFNAGYTRLFNCKLTINHIAFASLVSGKIDFNKEDIYLENSADADLILRELSRSYMEEIQNSDLDYLLIDFGTDIFYGILIANNNILTDDYRRVAKTKFYSQLENKRFLNLVNDPDEYFEIWRKSFDKFVEIINTIKPDVKIIINKARAVKKYRDNQGKIKEIVTVRNINRMNEMWDKFDDYAIKTYGFDYIDLSTKDYISYEDHPWEGQHPAHYIKEFYENFILELSSIVVKDQQENLYKLMNKKEHNMNLIDNSNFENGSDHWSLWQENFNIKNNQVEIDINCLEEKKINLILSNPIKVKKGELVNLSFKVYIDGNTKFDGSKTIFYLRIFERPTKNFKKDSIWHKNLKYHNYVNGDIRNQWVTVKYIFTAECNGFLKVGPGIVDNGHVIWKDIYLTNEIMNNSDWSHSYKDLIGKNRQYNIYHDNLVERSGDLELSTMNSNLINKQQIKIQFQNMIEEYENKIKNYENSNSWVITSPLRKISNKLKNLRKSIPSNLVKGSLIISLNIILLFGRVNLF